MTRAERRRLEKEQKKDQEKILHLTKNQFRELIKEEMEKVKKETTDEAVNIAMVLMFALPMKVLMDHFWVKSYERKLPEFTEWMLTYYDQWQLGEIDIENLREEIWEKAGVKLIEEDR